MKYLTIFVLVILISCTSKNSATESLLDAGYHPIEVGGYGFFKCGNQDVFATNFRAYSPDSTRVVTGCVCKGFLKGSTIRIN